MQNEFRNDIHSSDSYQGRMVLEADGLDNILHSAIWKAIFCLIRMIER